MEYAGICWIAIRTAFKRDFPVPLARRKGYVSSKDDVSFLAYILSKDAAAVKCNGMKPDGMW